MACDRKKTKTLKKKQLEDVYSHVVQYKKQQ